LVIVCGGSQANLPDGADARLLPSGVSIMICHNCPNCGLFDIMAQLGAHNYMGLWAFLFRTKDEADAWQNSADAKPTLAGRLVFGHEIDLGAIDRLRAANPPAAPAPAPAPSPTAGP